MSRKPTEEPRPASGPAPLDQADVSHLVTIPGTERVIDTLYTDPDLDIGPITGVADSPVIAKVDT